MKYSKIDYEKVSVPVKSEKEKKAEIKDKKNLWEMIKSFLSRKKKK